MKVWLIFRDKRSVLIVWAVQHGFTVWFYWFSAHPDCKATCGKSSKLNSKMKFCSSAIECWWSSRLQNSRVRENSAPLPSLTRRFLPRSRLFAWPVLAFFTKAKIQLFCILCWRRILNTVGLIVSPTFAHFHLRKSRRVETQIMNYFANVTWLPILVHTLLTTKWDIHRVNHLLFLPNCWIIYWPFSYPSCQPNERIQAWQSTLQILHTQQ